LKKERTRSSFYHKWKTKSTAGVLAFSTAISLITGSGVAAATENASAYVPLRTSDNRPIFDGKPEHLTSFVNYIMNNDMSVEDLIAFSDTRQPDYDANGEIIHTRTIKAGYDLPLFLDGTDNVQGVYTDFPSFIGLGNSWNIELASKIGSVIGNEKRGSVSIEDSEKALMWSAIGDIRNNPLSGRFEEGLSEDPYMSSVLTDTIASGISGVSLKDSNINNDFYLKTGLQSKHFAVYNGQWFRMSGSRNVSVRALHEYQLPTFIRQVENGSVVGFMTSYGRTNGIPNGISPNIEIAKDSSKYSLLLFTDFGAPINVAAGFGNEVDKTYVPDNEHMSALYANVGSVKGVFMYDGSSGFPTKAQTADGINRGLFGVSIATLKEAVRPVMELWVRLGYFNERNDQGLPIGYPYNSLIENPKNAQDTQSQQTALQAARESIVLLKNEDGVLPLKETSKVAVLGQFSDIRNKGVYAVKETPNLPGSGLTISEGIKNRIGKANVTVKSGGKVVAWQSQINNNYVSVDLSSKDGTLKANMQPDKALTDQNLFEVFDWGQDAFSFKSLTNGKFLNAVTPENDKPYLAINGDKPESIDNAIFSYESTGDNMSIRQGAFTGSFIGGFESHSVTNGNYLTTNGDAVTLDTNVPAYNSASDKRLVSYKEIVVNQPGQAAKDLAQTNDYAIIVVGAPPKINAGEGVDRAHLEMGADQYALVEKSAAEFKKLGKKTVVVINSSFPVAAESIQNNPNVDAVLFTPYGGQYDGKALAEVLFGDYAPTGRLQTTWYKDISSFPKINEYQLPEGSSAWPAGNPVSVSELDPRYTIDMENADPAEAKLTYMYTDAKITYPFGYGLTYTTFKYNNLSLPSAVSANRAFQVKVDVTNSGSVGTSDVVQLYAASDDSAYGSNVAKKRLAAFTKEYIPAGATKTVTLTVDPENLSIWDVTRQQHIVESGEYLFSIGSSSADADVKQKATSTVNGLKVAKLHLAVPTNVWDHTFASKDLVYKEVSKERTTSYAGDYYAIMSTKKGSWVGMPNVVTDNATGITLSVASDNPASTIEVREGSPTGTKLATLTFGKSGISTFKVPSLDGSGATLSEMAYEEVSVSLPKALKGTKDLYLVFDKKDIRVDSIQLNGTTRFKDVTKGYVWAEGAINHLAADLVVNGTSEDAFSPGKSIKRADFVHLLVKALDLHSNTTEQFIDVDTEAYYAKTLSIAKSLGIAGGILNGKFYPQKEMTRQDMVVLVAKGLTAAGKMYEEGKATDLQAFTDSKEVSSYALSSMATLVKGGIVKGNNNKLNPKAHVTRAEAAAILYRIYE
jgi:beta-glucosidase